MKQIYKAIVTTCEAIDENISIFSIYDRGILSQNILGFLRDLVEYSCQLIIDGEDANPNDQISKKRATKDIRTLGKYKFLYTFHQSLQKSVSHYTNNKDGAQRLMLKYYEYILRTKKMLKSDFSLDILFNLKDFPLKLNSELQEYYHKISNILDSTPIHTQDFSSANRYYIIKTKPFFINDKIYYEITFCDAIDYVSKFDRIIAFSKNEIIDNYSALLVLRQEQIQILNNIMPITIVDDWEISIRPCEFNNYSMLFGPKQNVSRSDLEYRNLMHFLTVNKMNLLDLVLINEMDYNNIKIQLLENTKKCIIFPLLDLSREVIKNNGKWRYTLRYLLFTMNNVIIKKQYSRDGVTEYSKLYINRSTYPFEQHPFTFSMKGHNPRYSSLIQCIDLDENSGQQIARFIKNNTENEGKLFTDISDLPGDKDINVLVKNYNNSLWAGHINQKICMFKNNYFIEEYVKDCIFIINKLIDISNRKISNYTPSVEFWLDNEIYIIDSPEKEKALKNMFSNSRVALIYGPAGTGKSYLTDHVAHFFEEKSKLFLAQTNPAVDNLKRKVSAANSTYSTIASFLNNKYASNEYDLLIIDECSTISNCDMREILKKCKFQLLLLVGDTYQIESIIFGNWFYMIKNFIKKEAVIELTEPYRTKNKDLLLVWKRVREIDRDILEPLVKNSYSESLNETIFDYTKDDQIILCLNYDGLYGINNINRFLQKNNRNEEIHWGLNTYKVGDPILFNETTQYSPLIYNNLKGVITDIKKSKNFITFDIEINKQINEFDAEISNLIYVGDTDNKNSIIRFTVLKKANTDEDTISEDSVVPFQIAYAVSIHKAQGLEYDYVKIIITDEIGEQVTHNIFYTAITRARKEFKIYWSPETEKIVLENFKKRDNKDYFLLKSYMDQL